MQKQTHIDTRKKVLFFLPSTTGGAERMTVNIAKMLPKERYEVKFVIVSRTLGTIIDFIPSRYEVLHIPVHNIYCMSTLRMTRAIMKEHADVVFCSLHYLNYRLIIAAKLTGAKVIIRMNMSLSVQNKHNLALIKLTYPYANMIIAQQEEMRQEAINMLNTDESNIISQQNPIDTELIEEKAKAPSPYKQADEQLKYVWVARFSKEKGQDLLVKAFAKVHEKRNMSHLYLIGEYDFTNDYDHSVMSLVLKLKLEEYVHFVGFDNNPYRWVKHSDVFVMPSRLEGLPNSLIEAMYLGKPVVATRCIPIIERIVEEGDNGYTVPSEDIDAMAEAMLKAPHLTDFGLTYHSATKEDFIRLFDEI